jgi:hypothetical protein
MSTPKIDIFMNTANGQTIFSVNLKGQISETKDDVD